MQRYDESYSDYYDSRDPDGYPYGKAVDASSPDTLDGTPIKASFFNDIIGMMQAIQKGASPEGTPITGRPERVSESDVWNALRGFIEREVQRVLKLVPSEATEENQLADKRFVDDAVSTNSAYFAGNFNSVDELPTEGVTNNDYAYVKRTEGDITYTDRYKYNGRKAAWEFEYTLDNTSVPIATASRAGLVKGGGDVSVGADGTMSVPGFPYRIHNPWGEVSSVVDKNNKELQTFSTFGTKVLTIVNDFLKFLFWSHENGSLYILPFLGEEAKPMLQLYEATNYVWLPKVGDTVGEQTGASSIMERLTLNWGLYSGGSGDVSLTFSRAFSRANTYGLVAICVGNDNNAHAVHVKSRTAGGCVLHRKYWNGSSFVDDGSGGMFLAIGY